MSELKLEWGLSTLHASMPQEAPAADSAGWGPCDAQGIKRAIGGCLSGGAASARRKPPDGFCDTPDETKTAETEIWDVVLRQSHAAIGSLATYVPMPPDASGAGPGRGGGGELRGPNLDAGTCPAFEERVNAAAAKPDAPEIADPFALERLSQRRKPTCPDKSRRR
jgi:hypothetical protein